MAVIDWEKKNSVAVITMNNGENRHNMEFAETMISVLDEILLDDEISSAVLTSEDAKNFSQGVDIEWLGGRMAEKDSGAIKKWMYLMNDVFKKLLLFPVPVIASINGHAFGNGAILSCACDFRFMKGDRGYFCFPEINIGIPFLPGMIAFVKKSIPYYKFNEMLLTGERYTAPELEEHKVIIKSCADQEDLMNKTMEYASSFSKKRGIFGEMKKRLHKDIIEIMDREDRLVIEPLFLMVQD